MHKLRKDNDSQNMYRRLTALLQTQKRSVIESLMFMVTYQCQLDCSYCEVARAEERRCGNYMAREIMYKGIDFLSTSSSHSLQLRFFGGEPLLCFDTIKQAIDYASKKGNSDGKEYKFSFVTNGLLLDREKVHYLSQYDSHIMFSIDGDIPTQRQYRLPKKRDPHVYRRIEENLVYLIDSGMAYHVNMLVMPDNAEKMSDNIDHLIALGVDKIQIGYAAGLRWPEEKIRVFMHMLEKSIYKAIRARRDVEFLNLFNNSEPVIVRNEVIIDCDGKIYLDPAIFMEKKLSRLRNIYCFKHERQLTNIDNCSFSEKECFDKLLETYRDSPWAQTIIINNVYFGLRVKRLIEAIRKTLGVERC